MKIIDLRCRPAFLHPFFGGVPGSPEHATTRWLNRRVGTRGADNHFERSLTQEGFLGEVREAGLYKAVVVGRHTPAQHLPNDLIHSVVNGHAELVGVGAVEPVMQGVEGALAEIDRAIDVLGLAAIDLEPGFAEPARHADDPLYWPIYAHLQARGVALFVMSGPTTPDPAYNDPGRLAAVARAFPELKIVVSHGYWPNVQQAIGVAFRYENIHLLPDMYLFQAGSEAYVQAANGFLADQLLFGSSYTFRPIRQSIEDAQRLGLRDEVLEKFFYGNAARILNIE
ncbi:amidohydrolase [Pseudomonas alkylphenolica]|uniref:Amidohydrolase n=1 Tax=Pseudomonas alkylphenolica TaxID=237609 RepID=A0A443ZQL8_9PSED|nr:amidohydrolase family protein [Pseudomonas alkylphenolica]RWU21382.1 amidohydrolase [Pseudomonas alkylphenolica]